MGCDALQQCERIANPVGGCGSELRGVEEGVDGDDLLNEGGHNTWNRGRTRKLAGYCEERLWFGDEDAQRTEGVPQDQGKLWDLLSLLAEFQQSLFTRSLAQEVGDIAHSATVVLGHVWVLGGGVLVNGAEDIRVVWVGGHAAVMGLGGSSGDSLLLSMLVVGLLLLNLLLLLHPGRGVLRIVVLAAVHGGVIWHHLDGLLGWPAAASQVRVGMEDGAEKGFKSRGERYVMEMTRTRAVLVAQS